LWKRDEHFYFNKIPCYKNVWLVTYKLSCGAREWWFEVLGYRACTGKPLTPSWKDLRQSLILKFVQNNYEDILYWIDKQIDCYYLLFVQPFRIEMKKNMEEVSSLQSRHFQHHLFDKNNTTATTTLPVNVSSTNGEEEI